MSKTELTIGLLSHPLRNDNLGCVALAISNIIMLDEVIKSIDYKVNFQILVTDNIMQVPMEFTSNCYEYLVFPRSKQSLRNPIKLISTKVFDECDIVFNLCGGDGYTDIYGFGRLLSETYMTIMAKIKGKPVVFAPQTIGPFKRKISNFVAKVTLNTTRAIFTRDAMSQECCKELGLHASIYETIDVAFGLPYTIYEHPGKKKKLGLNVSGLLYNGGYNRKNYFNLSFSYEKFINLLLEELINTEYEVHLVPHVISENNTVEDDYRVCRKLSDKFSTVKLSPRFSSPIEAKSYIAGLDVFSGARMHSTIAAFSCGIPVIPIAYSRKFNGLYDTLCYPYFIDAKGNETEISAVKKFFGFLNNLSPLRESVNLGKTIYQERLNMYKNQIAEILLSL